VGFHDGASTTRLHKTSELRRGKLLVLSRFNVVQRMLGRFLAQVETLLI